MDGIFEELDAPNEFFYDPKAQNLYYYNNGTGAPPSTGFVVTNLKVLIAASGTMAKPVKGIQFKGLTFQNAAYTCILLLLAHHKYFSISLDMDPHGVPSGGDWGLQRTGAVFLEGTQDAVVENCTFIRLDGIGLFLSAYN